MIIHLGIDLGTTNTSACYLEHGTLKHLRFRNSENLPSTLLYLDEKIAIGEIANKKSNLYPAHYIRSAKTYLADNITTWDIENRLFTATDVASEILKEVVKTVKERIANVTDIHAVITVPAYFSSAQIQETNIAAERSGLVVLQIITEPVAAAIAYGVDDNIDQTLFVVDIGGGTFDTSILQVTNNQFTTLAIDGDNKLGGDNFDETIFRFLIDSIYKQDGINLASMKQSGLTQSIYHKARYLLMKKAEEAKIQLSEFEVTTIDIANLYPGYSCSIELTRDKFEQLAKAITDKINDTILRTLKQSNKKTAQIDKVILVGGSAKLPIVYQLIDTIFSQRPYSDKPLDKLVSMGAAIFASNEDTLQRKDKEKIVVNDILSHSLGIEVAGRRLSIILPRNTPYPIKKTEPFTTIFDQQRQLNIKVYEGEDTEKVKNNTLHGGFILTGIEKSMAGKPQIAVTFEFDKNRILTVSAKDKKTKASQQTHIEIHKTIITKTS